MKRMIFGAAMALTLAGCQSVGDKTLIGASGGAIAGAGLGTIAGGDDKRNAAIGAVVGGLAGAAVGAYMDKQEADLREAVKGTGIEVARQGDQIALTMPSNITFDVDSALIKPEFRTSLDDVAATLVAYPQTAVDIVGHASSDGNDAYNQRLSEDRAASVQVYLMNQNLQAVRIQAYGRGETQPIADNATQAGRAANRRVEVLLTPIVEDEA